MIPWLFRFFLAAELAVLVAIALAMPQDAGAQRVVLVLIIVMLLWRISHAGVTWCLAQGMRLRDGRAPDWRNQFAALGKEIAARMISFNWSQPFPALALGPDPLGAREGTPILLVHGFFSSRGMWVRFRRRLADAGLGPVYAMDLEHVFGHIKDMVPSLDARIEQICGETGAQKVILIAHSMGGLVSRQYLQDRGSARIAQLITLGSPHHGTRIAKLALFTCAADMRQGSSFLETLSAKEAANPPDVRAVSIYTLNDDLVYPPETSIVSWAENVELRGVGHVSLLFDGPVFEQVRAHLPKDGN
jgi:triacylglycerol lipase